jgi:hypothetical protein
MYLLYRGCAVGPRKGSEKPLLDVHFRLCSVHIYWPHERHKESPKLLIAQPFDVSIYP